MKSNTLSHLIWAPLSVLLVSTSQAADILLVSSNSNPTLETFLSTEGHTVTQEARTTGPDNANDFDFIIFDRDTNSGSYRDNDAVGQKQADWNAVSTPTLSFSTFVMRASRFGWIINENLGTNTPTDSFVSPFPDPAHPFLAGLTGTPELAYTTPVSIRTYASAQRLTSGITVVTEAGSAGSANIFTINPGTVLADTQGTPAGGLRIAWGIENGDSGWDLAGPNAEQILRNIITAVTSVSDSDGDGMDDLYEDINGLDKNDNGTLFPGLGPSGDKDMDGLTNLQEHDGLNASNIDHGFGQTRADNDDTDGDLVLDNEEVTGASNTAFASAPTNPNNPDSDGDGLDDEQETSGSQNTANSNAPTNPNAVDTDGDTMDDLYEVTNNLLGGLDPNLDDAAGNLDLSAEMAGGNTFFLTNLQEYTGSENSGDIQTRADKGDTDDDGAPDHSEDNFGSWSDTFSVTGTNPAIPDTDGDGLLDGFENPTTGNYPLSGSPSATNQSLSDPNLADTDEEGLLDGAEVLSYGTSPSVKDTDGDGTEDAGEQHLYGTDPTNGSNSPNAAQLAELRVNFQLNADNAVLPDFQLYQADHEDGGVSWTDMTYSAFGGSNNVTVGVSWDAGSGVGLTRPQLFNNRLPAASVGPLEWPALLADWAGTDERSDAGEGEGMTVTVSGLPAGNYLWTSLHLDAQDRAESFNATLTSSNGSVAGPTLVDGITSGNGGANLFDEVTQYQQTFSSNGSDPVEVYFETNGAFFFMNAFLITNTNLPHIDSGLVVTNCEIEAASGDFLMTFSPGGTDYIVTSSNDLNTAFTAVPSATLENSNTTFRVPAADLNAGQDFFRVEEAP